MLTPGNARRLAERLSHAARRGDEGGPADVDGRPRRAAAGLCRAAGGLRDQAHTMPATQLTEVLEAEYGPQLAPALRG
jgi:aarF domain-containing kinase